MCNKLHIFLNFPFKQYCATRRYKNFTYCMHNSYKDAYMHTHILEDMSCGALYSEIKI